MELVREERAGGKLSSTDTQRKPRVCEECGQIVRGEKNKGVLKLDKKRNATAIDTTHRKKNCVVKRKFLETAV